MIDGFRPSDAVQNTKYIPIFSEKMFSGHLPTEKWPILKIDVEGAELDVIQGLTTWIIDYKPFILMEILPVYTQENAFRYYDRIRLKKF